MINKLDHTRIAEHILKHRPEGHIALVFEERQYLRVLFKVSTLDLDIEYYEENPHMLWQAVRDAAYHIGADYADHAQDPTAGTPQEREERAFAWHNMVTSPEGLRVTTLALGSIVQDDPRGALMIYQKSVYGQAWLRTNEELKEKVRASDREADREAFQAGGKREFTGLKGY